MKDSKSRFQLSSSVICTEFVNHPPPELCCSSRFNWKIIVYPLLNLMHKWSVVSRTQLLKHLLPWILLSGLSAAISACHSDIWVILVCDFTKYASLLLFTTYRQWILFLLNEIKLFTSCYLLQEFTWRKLLLKTNMSWEKQRQQMSVKLS